MTRPYRRARSSRRVDRHQRPPTESSHIARRELCGKFSAVKPFKAAAILIKQDVRIFSQVRNGEPSVALIIDGVAQASPSVITQELFDIDSIQVLKGPQGSLYGRDSLGGAIVINTTQPTNDTEGVPGHRLSEN